MIQTSDSIKNLLAAMHKVQGQVEGVAKDATNPHFKRSYASLESVVDTLRAPCQAAGLVIIQAPGECMEGTIAVTTMIGHAESGEWLRSTVQLPMAKSDPQGAGSAITYAERYSLMALFNLPPVDDDAEAASRPVQPRERQSAPPQRAGAESPPASPVGVSSGGVRAALAAMRKNETKAALLSWFKTAKPKLDAFSEEDQASFFAQYDEMLRSFDRAAA